MAATRLSEGQKGEIVARFGNGESSQELASAYGCSTATITRVVKAALSPDDYERLKAQRGRRSRGSGEPEAGPAAETQAELSAKAPAPVSSGNAPALADGTADAAPPATLETTGGRAGAGRRRTGSGIADPAEEADPTPAVLAIDDAEDFGGDDEDFSDEDGGDGDGADFTPIPVVLNLDNDTLVEPRPLQEAALAASAYMLVDKTVELQARPLSDLPELGRLAPGEEERQALVMFLNPRQAKRQCGRTQRVIKMPDLGLLERTAPYLLAQGISRVVIEGALYALPGS